MNPFERIAEAKIRQGIEQGEFDDLAGRGEPLDLDDLRGVRAEDRAAYTLLRNSGFAPEEVGTRRELAEAVGCSISHLWRIEAGDRQYASLKLLNRIAAYLTERSGREIPVTEFFTCGCECTHSAA